MHQPAIDMNQGVQHRPCRTGAGDNGGCASHTRAKCEACTAGDVRHADIHDEVRIKWNRDTGDRREPLVRREQHEKAVGDVCETDKREKQPDDHVVSSEAWGEIMITPAQRLSDTWSRLPLLWRQ